MPGTPTLVFVFVIWAAACLALAGIFLRRAPVVSLALGGSLVGALAGFVFGNADGPAQVPAYTAVGASLGLFVFGITGLLTTSPRTPSRSLNRTALLVLPVAPFAAGGLTMLLQLACPLYVSGKDAGFCNYRGADLLGGWVTGVIVAFLVDAAFVAGLLKVAAWQWEIRQSDGAIWRMASYEQRGPSRLECARDPHKRLRQRETR